MKTKTVTREYDEQGRVVKETTLETEHNGFQSAACTCWMQNPATVVPHCPVHGYRQAQPLRTTCGTSINVVPAPKTFTINGQAVAKAVAAATSHGRR